MSRPLLRPASPRAQRLLPLTIVLALAGSLIALTSPATPARAADDTTAAATEITSGAGLDWGYKASWRDYIGDSGVTLSDGATLNDDDTYHFTFASGSYDADTGATELSFTGTVHWEKYCGYWAADPDLCVLDTTMSDVRLVIDEDEQSLYAHLISRARGGSQGDDVTDFGEILLATLDITDATVTASEELTSWSGIAASVADDTAASATSYAAGTAMDPVSFSYDGPGGAPDLTETWDVEGAPAYTDGAVWAGPDTWRLENQVFASDDGVLIAYSYIYSGGLVDRFTAIDAATMTTLGSPLVFTPTDNLEGQRAFDPETGTLFYVQRNIGDDGLQNAVQALTWDADSEALVTSTVGYLPASESTTAAYPFRSIAWNAALGELDVMFGNATVAPQLYRFVSADDGWQTSVVDLPVVTTNAAYYGNSASDSLAALGDGSLLVARAANYLDDSGTRTYLPVLYLVIGESTVEVQEVADSTIGEGTFGFQNVVAVDDDTAAVYTTQTSDSARGLAFVTVTDGTAAMDGDLVTDFTRMGKMAGDAELGLAFGYDYNAQKVLAYRGDTLVSSFAVTDGYASTVYTQQYFGIDKDHNLYAQVQSGGYVGILRLDFVGTAPEVTTQPESQTVTLGSDETTTAATFTTAGTGDPDVAIQWQAKAAGASTFADLDGETAESLSVAADRSDNGTVYRAVLSNEAGSVVTDEATLTVLYPAVVSNQPRAATVTEGSSATFSMIYAGSPDPTVTWQRRVDGFWTAITDDDDDVTVATSDGTSSLTVAETNTDMSGTRFRAKLVNDAGTTHSDAVTLTVTESVTIPADGLDLTGVTLDWSGSAELQAAPPYGSSNYFSAGVSDGTQATYAATSGDVEILQIAADGTETTATYATRAAQVDGSVTQTVRLSDGQAEVAADGSATVTWEGTWSVNFYDGLVPFWLTDPVLTVDADGTGTLTADLDGYSSTMDDPTNRTALDATADVTVAAFSGVEFDPYGEVSVDPDYEGVAITVADGYTAQDTTSDGWGSWPQSFVDFHFDTGLSSYWYSSGGTADPEKAPREFTVDFTDATEADTASDTTDTASDTADTASGSSSTWATLTLARPTITGKPRTGRKLTAHLVLPTGLDPALADVDYQWYAGKKKIKGARAATLRLTKKLAKRLAGKRLSVTVTLSYTGYQSATATSAKTTKVRR
ncbi:HtaA domain-containing protein [Nocardioides sp.]|uniref:HtaA domain-containing protein n=1 Tax=Nocardioides sp. TaxID=35761 RepID=UPI0039E21890